MTEKHITKFFKYLPGNILELRKMVLRLAVIVVLMGWGNMGWGQVSITSTGTAFTESFDGLGSSATATLPTGFKIGTDWSTGTTATTLAYGTTGTGVVTGTSGGGTINWANGITASATDRSLGFLNTGTFTSPRSIVYAFTNNTASTITSLQIIFDYEKSRSGSRQFDWTFLHGSTSNPSTSATGGDQTYAADANNTVISNPPVTTNKSFSITGLSIANGATYYLKWTFTGLAGSSNGQGIGIDNFSITASSVTNLYWGGTNTLSYSGAWTTATPWGTTASSGANTAWPASGTIVANFNANPGAVTIPASISVVPNSTIINSSGVTTFNTAVATDGNLSSPITLTTGLTTAPVSATTLTLSGIISGSGGITQSGAGTTTFSAVNTYTGITTINAGTLSVGTIGNGGVAGNLGQATNAVANLVLGGGALQYTGSTASTDRNFTLTGSTTSFVDVTTNTLTLLGAAASTSGALTKTGNGTLVLSGNSQYTGITTISAGTLQLGATGISPNGPLGTTTNGTTVSNGAVLDLNGITLATAEALSLAGTGISSSGALTNSSATAATYSGSVTVGASTGVGGTGNITLTGAVGGSGSFTKLGGNVLILSGNNTYSGATTVSVGTLRLNSTSALGTTAGSTSITSGAVLDLNGITYATAEPLVISGNGIASGGTLINSSATAASFAGAITLNSATNSIGGTGDITLSGGIAGGTNALTKVAANTLTLGASTYTGATTVSAGTLNLTGSLTSAISISSGATLSGTGSTTSTAAVSGTISPGGTGIGTLTTGAQTWNTGGTYRVDLSNTTGSAGTDWDNLLINGGLTTPGGSPNFTISVNGTIGNFTNTNNYTWVIGTYTGTDPSASFITVVSSGITNPLSGGSFAVSFSGNNVILAFTAGTGTITTTAASFGGPFCNTGSNIISVAYSITGSFTGTYKVQISDGTGSFTPTTTGSTIIGTGGTGASATSPISATIPSGLTAGSGYRVRVVNDGPATYGTDNGTSFTINEPPVITTNPDNVQVTSPAAASFTVTATGTITSYLWQVSDDGGTTWATASGGVYTGGTTATLSISSSAGLTGNQYRVVITGPCGTATSTAGILTVNVSGYLWTNPITGSNPSTTNPFTSGDDINSSTNISVSGIGRGSGIAANAGANRYNASGWTTSASIDLNDYFNFTLTPLNGYKINFTSLVFASQKSTNGPANFAIRSSADNYGSNITTFTSATGGTFSLTDPQFQDISAAISFRIYGWNASTGTGTYSIDNFTFNGSLASGTCTTPAGSLANGNTSPQITNVSPGCFLANWTTVSSINDYKLDVSTFPTFATSTGNATDLFISEYIEGNSFNKYIEIFNGTGASVNLGNYVLRLYSNGASSPSQSVTLSGTLANNDVIVLKNSQATLYSGTATTNDQVINFNGDDALALYKTSTSAFVDIFGRIGEDPGSAWTTGGNTTVNKTLVRKATVAGGVTTNPTSGFPTLSSEWDQYNQDVEYLGSHTFTGPSVPSFVTGYNNLAVTGTSNSVTGLTPGTTYYYRLRAVGCTTGDNSNVVQLVTTALSQADLRSRQTGNYGTAANWEYDPGCSQSWITTTTAPGGNNNVTILSSHIVTFNASGTINSGKTFTINSGGSFVMGGNLLTGAGAFDLQSGATLSIGDATGITASGATGNVQVTGSRTFSTGANYTYTAAGAQATGSGLPATVNNLTLAGTNQLSLTSGLTVAGTLASGASTDLNLNGQSLNLNGTISNTAGATFSGTTGSSLIVGGTGSVLNSLAFKSGSQNLSSLTLNRAATSISLGSPLTVNTSLGLTSGVLTTSSTNLLTLASGATFTGGTNSNSYVNGPLRRYINNATALTYPVGKSTAASPYRPVIFTPATGTTGTADYFTGEYFNATVPAGFMGGPNLLGLVKNEYWQFDRSGTAEGYLTMTYNVPSAGGWWDTGTEADASDPCNTCTVQIAKRSAADGGSGSSPWQFTYAGAPPSGGPFSTPKGTSTAISTDLLTSFSYFGFGYSLDVVLPVNLLSFTARLAVANGQLNWKVEDAKDLAGFDLEYSADGSNYRRLATIATNGGKEYSYLHTGLQPGQYYYRLLVKDKSSKNFYSKVVTLSVGNVRTYLVGVSPTVVSSTVLPVIFSAKEQMAEAFITDVLGRKLTADKMQLKGGSNQWRINTQMLSKGTYFISILTQDGLKETRKFVKE